jgi:coproporphyrinogen III oxidase-like Fe-S oxidoreductase
MKKLLVYVHVPFCVSKCHFCDWVQEIPTSQLRLDSASPARVRYLGALVEQIRRLGPRLSAEGYAPEILYWGGGTASILTPAEVRVVMGALREHFDLGGLAEATIECSPETLSAEKLEALAAAGFRRVSIGVQSFDDRRLRTIGRAHSARGASDSIRAARSAGFCDVNIDLICGFPDETLAEFEASLARALEHPINHVSLYHYRPAHGTVLRRQLREGLREIRLEEQLAAYERGREVLGGAGFREYALGHFGAPPCRSDMAYFKLEMDWVGFGSGATSLLGQTFFATRRGRLADYTARPAEWDDEYPAASPRITPRLMYQALSTFEGARSSLWKERTGADLGDILAQEPVASLIRSLGAGSRLIRDADGVRLPRAKMAESFIQLQYLNSPHGFRPAGGAQQVSGGH